jgi:hypothetical protein
MAGAGASLSVTGAGRLAGNGAGERTEGSSGVWRNAVRAVATASVCSQVDLDRTDADHWTGQAVGR